MRAECSIRLVSNNVSNGRLMADCRCLPLRCVLAPPLGERENGGCSARRGRPTAGGAAASAQVHRAAGRTSCEAVTASMRVFVLTRSRDPCFGWKRRPLASLTDEPLKSSFEVIYFPDFFRRIFFFLVVDFYGLSKMDSGYLPMTSPTTCEL